jgi:DME family drug/metabolite transporter
VRTTLVAIYLGLVATALAYALVIFSLRHLSASRTLTILLAQPLLAIAAGAWLLGEPVNATLAAAAAALAGALALRALPDRFFLPSLFLKGLHLAQPVPPRPSDR